MKMKKKRSRICYYVSAAWLAVCGAVLLYLSVYGDGIPSLYKGKLFGVFGCLAVLILSVISYAGGELYWIDVSAADNSRKTAARMVLFFLAGTVIQVVYAAYTIRYGRVSLLQDSMITSGIFCVAAMAARGTVSSHPAGR